MKKELPASILILLLGSLAYFLSPLLPYLNGVMAGLLLGLLAGNFLPARVTEGKAPNWMAGKGLEWAILLLSFSINYQHLISLGWQSLLYLILVMAFVLWLSPKLAKKLGCPGQSGILIAFGTAICGSSAIAALSPQIKASKSDTATAMAVVNLLGIVFMLLFPVVLPQWLSNPDDQGFMIGASLHAVGNVAGAAYALGPEIGEYALGIKLARVALITPALFFVYALTRDKTEGAAQPGFKMPWYLWGFLAVTVVNSLFNLPPVVTKSAISAGEMMLTLAMVAIGLRIRIGALMSSGKRGLSFGLLIFGIQAGLFLLISLLA
ncbi:MAG: putative sulfate exporter family transporter [Bacteroidetes bacterium]|nr:MAG: putative sulfate exporter family transporter [Bacteroidota bacterium]